MTGPEGGSSDAIAGHLENVAAGDLIAFEQLYRITSATLFGVCTRILQEPHEAEEALQDAYLAVWRRAGSFDPRRGSARAWLATLARHVAIDRLRARSRVAAAPLEFADEVPDEAPLAPDLIERSQDRDRLEICLERLAPGDVTLIRSAFFQGSTYSELAARARRPLGTVKSRIRRALIQLAECLQ